MTILKIERFQLIHEITKEQHATVYEALNDKNNQSVHLRLYPSNYLAGEEMKANFETRGSILNRISHPAILPVYQYGSFGDQPYIVSPVMGGGSLTEILRRRGKLKPSEIVPIAERLGDALDALHAVHAAHGNINPDAVWFNAERIAYLGGFIMPPVEPDQLRDLSSYSPEYLENRKLIRQSDIYSLTVLLYQMLTGTTPFKGKSVNEIPYMLLHDQIPSVGDYYQDQVAEIDRFFKLGLDYVGSNRPIFASELVNRFKNIFRISTGADQVETAVHDELNLDSTKVNITTNKDYTPDFEEEPDWMFVFGQHDRAKKQNDYTEDRYESPQVDFADSTQQRDLPLAPNGSSGYDADLKDTNVYTPPAASPSSAIDQTQTWQTSAARTSVTEAWTDQGQNARAAQPKAKGSRSMMSMGIFGLIGVVIIGGLLLFGLSLTNVLRQSGDNSGEETAAVNEEIGQDGGQETAIVPADGTDSSENEDTTEPVASTETETETEIETSAETVEEPIETVTQPEVSGPVVNIPIFDLDKINGNAYAWESSPPSTTFLRRSRSNGFELEDAGWYMYSNGNKIRDVLEIDNKIYAASGSGLTVWDLQAGSATRLTTYDGLVGNDINQITYCEMPEPRLLIASESGLGILNLETLENEIFDVDGRQLISNQVSTVQCKTDRQGTKLYVGYTNDGLTIHDLKRDERSRIDRSDGLPTDAVHQILLIDDNIWINTGSSLLVFNEETSETVSYSKASETLPTQNISEMVWDSEHTGLIWMATNDGLMAGNSKGEFTLYTDENTNLPRGLGKSVSVDSNGTIWYGSGFGNVCAFSISELNCAKIFNHPSAEFQLENGITAIHVSQGNLIYGHQNDGVWVGNFVGGDLTTSELATDKWQPLLLPNQFPTNDITALAEADGHIWVGTRRGLYKAPIDDLTGATWEYFDASNSVLPANWITELFADPAGGIWVGTFRGAVYIGDEWINDPIMIDQQIRTIGKDNQEKNIWIGTARGLFQYNGRSVSEMKDLPTIDIRTMLWVKDDLYLGLEDGRIGVRSGGVFNIFDRSNSPLSTDPITVIQEGPNNTLYIGNGDDLYVLNQSRTMVQIPQVRGFYISDLIFQELSNETLVSTTSNAMYYYNSIDWEKISVRDGLPSDRIQEMIIDSFGTIWFAGASTNEEGGGLARYIPYPLNTQQSIDAAESEAGN